MAGYNYYNQQTPAIYNQYQQPVRYVNPYEPQYVTGIEGANAFQLPQGVTQMILWDTDNDSFYIKKLDEMGRPRVVAWKDFTDHVEPEKSEIAVAQSQDAGYLTRAEAEELINQVLSQLTVGERGRIVRVNELDS